MNIPSHKVLGLSILILLLSACGSSSSSNENPPPHPPNSSNEPGNDDSNGNGDSNGNDDTNGNDDETAGGWTLIWSDEFEGDRIDSSKWSHEVNCWGGGNEEAQCYTADPKNSYVQDNILHITAVEEAEPYCGSPRNQEDPAYDPTDTSACKPYTSARLRTKGKADWTYGRVEVNARMPSGLGYWPAIWMLPTDTVYGAWPHSGEIDIFEAFNPGVDEFTPANEVAGTLHYGFSWPWNQYTGKDGGGEVSFEPEANIWDEFHTYAVEWEEGEIRWYVDDTHIGTQNSDGWFTYYWGGQEIGYQTSKGGQPFDQDFHLILNLAIGSPWMGFPDATTTFPQSMEVNYVRVYECSADPETGKGCATVDPDITPVGGHAPLVNEWEEIVLFENGVQSVDLGEFEDAPVINTLNPGFWSPDDSIASDPGFAVDGDTVWDVRFNNGVGSAFLTADDMAIDGLDAGVSFGGDNLHNRARQVGEFKFDLRVLEIAPGTNLRVKLDSGWPNVSFHEIEVPEVGEWAEVSVRFYTLQDNDIDWGSVDYTSVTNLFVIEPSGDGGATHVQLNNIRIVCLISCDHGPVVAEVPITDDLTLFEGGSVNAALGYELHQWSTGAPVTVGLTDALAEVAERGQVVDIQYTAPEGTNGIAFIQSPVPKDLSAFVGGKILFDLYVADYGSSTGNLIIEFHTPDGNGVADMGVPVTGEWHPIELNIDDFVGGNLGSVNTPFVIMPAWDAQGTGVHLQVDNIRWELP